MDTKVVDIINFTSNFKKNYDKKNVFQCKNVLNKDMYSLFNHQYKSSFDAKYLRANKFVKWTQLDSKEFFSFGR